MSRLARRLARLEGASSRNGPLWIVASFSIESEDELYEALARAYPNGVPACQRVAYLTDRDGPLTPKEWVRRYAPECSR